MRRLAGTRKVGHAGTLDPMATGRARRSGSAGRPGCSPTWSAPTRSTPRRSGSGVTTTTDDAEGEVLARTDATARDPRRRRARRSVPLTGDIRQVPSSVSAIKVDGRRAYARVRAGEAVELADRPVTVSRFVVHDVRPVPAGGGPVPGESAGEGAGASAGERAAPPAVDVDVTVVCSSGTYVRALARDLGAGLGVGGHLTALRRTRVGGYGLRRRPHPGRARGRRPTTSRCRCSALADAARATFPVRDLTDAEARSLSFGHRIPLTPGTPRRDGRRDRPGRHPGRAAGDRRPAAAAGRRLRARLSPPAACPRPPRRDRSRSARVTGSAGPAGAGERVVPGAWQACARRRPGRAGRQDAREQEHVCTAGPISPRSRPGSARPW